MTWCIIINKMSAPSQLLFAIRLIASRFIIRLNFKNQKFAGASIQISGRFTGIYQNPVNSYPVKTLIQCL